MIESNRQAIRKFVRRGAQRLENVYPPAAKEDRYEIPAPRDLLAS